MCTVVGRVQRPRPGVEELHGRSSRIALCFQEPARDAGQPSGEEVPGLGVGVHHGAGAQVLLRRTALDEVGGERERSACEADERGVAEFCRDDANGLGDRGGVDAFRVDRRDAVDVGAGADGVCEHRAAAGLDDDIDAGEAKRDDDVAEEDRCVDPVAAYGLQRDLGGEFRGETGIQHPRSYAKLAVFGERTSGLTHEPDRQPFGPPAGVRAQKRGLHFV